MAVWNARDVNDDRKRMEVVNVCKNQKLDVLGMYRTNTISNEQDEWDGVECIRMDVGKEEKCKKGMDPQMKSGVMQKIMCVSEHKVRYQTNVLS